MTAITVRSQAELNTALADPATTRIIIDSPRGVWLHVQASDSATVAAYGSATVAASGSATVEAHGSATVRASGSATVAAYDSATVAAYGSATVAAYGSATVAAYGSATVAASGSATVRAHGSATVEAHGSATVRASGSATVEAHGSATVEAYDSATVQAHDLATVRASGSATVEAHGSATVAAYGSATVEAYGSATVEAYGSATVEAHGSATVQAHDSATVRASAWVAIHLHSAHATVAGRHIIDVTGLDLQDPATWCAYHGVQVDDDGRARLYKAVDDNLAAGRAWQPTTYPVGQTVTAPDWRDDNSCGHGLHVCPRPAQARDHYHEATRYLEVAVPVDQLRPIDDSKAKAPEVYVVREVDLSGRPVEVVAES